MAKTIKYAPIDRIISKAHRELGYDFSESDAIEWIGQAMEYAQVAGNYEEAVAFCEVKDHRCLIPNGVCYIIQIARDNSWNPATASVLCPADIVEEAETDSGVPVPIDCHGTPITDYDLAFYRPYFDLIYEYEGWTGSKRFSQCFSPVRLKTHSFFNSLVCKEVETCALYNTSEDEYNINDPYLMFSFKEGMVAVSYLRFKLDDQGFPMIPDRPEYAEAAVSFMRQKLAYREYDKDPSPGNERKLERATKDWHWYVKQAKNWGMMPGSVDERQNLSDQSQYLLPRQHRYYNFFGKLGKPEQRIWNTPRGERRYGHYSGFRGQYL